MSRHLVVRHDLDGSVHNTYMDKANFDAWQALMDATKDVDLAPCGILFYQYYVKQRNKVTGESRYSLEGYICDDGHSVCLDINGSYFVCPDSGERIQAGKTS